MVRSRKSGAGAVWALLALLALGYCATRTNSPSPRVTMPTPTASVEASVEPQAGTVGGSGQSAAAETRYVSANGVRLREEPSTAARVRGTYNKGTAVVVLGSKGDWLKVRVESSGTMGWMHGKYLAATTAQTVTTTRTKEQPTQAKKKRSTPSDAAIAQLLIAASIDAYPGNCPCPYNRDRAGRRCGGRSAYSRPGGYAPLCYPGDVPKSEIEAYRRRLEGGVD